MKLLFISILLAFAFSGCQSNEAINLSRNQSFLSKYGNENFDEFRNYSAVIRSWDNGDPIIIVFAKKKYTDTCNRSTALVVTIDHKTGQVKSMGSYRTDSCTVNFCQVDTALSIKIASTIIHYGINCLAVDSNSNVSVSTFYTEGGHKLIRFSNKRFITEKYKMGWRYKGCNWYEKIEF